MLTHVHVLLFVVVKWVDDDEAVVVPCEADAITETETVVVEIRVDVEVVNRSVCC